VQHIIPSGRLKSEDNLRVTKARERVLREGYDICRVSPRCLKKLIITNFCL
jgi:hypothetical protein